MIPSNTNTTAPCSPISSNCVIWQGPDISCIDLCNGDSVSDVVAALATKLCAIIDAACTCNPDLTGLDLKCTLASSTPTPTTLEATIQVIVDFVCAQAATTVTVPNLALPICLQYRPCKTCPLVTDLPLAEWAVLVGNAICNLTGDLIKLDQGLQDLNNRVAILEACVLPCTPDGSGVSYVVSSCLFPGTSVSVQTLLIALEVEFCSLLATVGSEGQVGAAISSQGVHGSNKRLASAGTIGEISGWISSPSNLAQSLSNGWRVVDDLYAAVADIQANAPIQCDGASFVFTYNTIDASGTGLVTSINLNFQGTTLPQGFTDCGGSTLITITDSNGSFVNQSVVVSNLTSSTGGVNIDITSLNRMQSLSLSIPFCVTDGVSQCSDRQQVIVPLTIPCPSVNVSNTAQSITVSFINLLGPTVSYRISATSLTTGVVFGNVLLNNQQGQVNYSFPNPVPGETYSIVLSIETNGINMITCPAQTTTIPGSTCIDLEVTTPSATAPVTGDVFLGLYDDGPAITRYWYDPTTSVIKLENVGATVPCNSPILSNPVMDYLGTAGDVQVTVSYGTEPSPISAEISYSIDGITYIGSITGASGARVITTGQTSGSVYIKVQTTCTGPIISVPTIIRYDFGTTVWTTMQSPAECANTSITTGCPAGIEVARQFLNCGPSTYTVFGGSADSYWFYIGKREVANVGTRYIYAGWDNTTQSVRTVVECCTCPTFILIDPIQVLCGQNGDSVTVTVPYVLGAGEPEMTILTNPVLGTVVQGTNSNEFIYTAINPNASIDYADSFQIQLQPSVPGTGSCSLTTAVIQVQYINNQTKLSYRNQDLYVFINTNGYTSTEGGLISQGITMLTAYWGTEFGYTGDVYIIPTDSKRWAGYPKAIVDNGGSWTQSANASWQALEALPSSWPGGSGVGVSKNTATVLIFSNDSSGDYHDATLASGYGSGATAQPTLSYKEDYDSIKDMLLGQQNSVWAQTLGITQNQFPNGLSIVLYPLIVDGSGGADAATALQMISAYTAELIPPSKYGIATAPDLTSYILQGFAPTMPYTGATTPSNTITQLFKNEGLGMLALLNQEKSVEVLNEIKDGTNAQFTNTLTRAIKSDSNAYPSASVPVTNVFEVQDCAGVWAPWFVTITSHGCGTISNGSVIKLTNSGADVPSSGTRPTWLASTNKCVTIVANCSATTAELTVALNSTYDACLSCTP
tara:strand:- start:4466 stop:8077 length:3612 start_codon:yes stop_codon:yes gene_type:complete